MLTLSNLTVQKGAKQKKQRRGRGDASGRGNYSGRGMKGQGARSGVSGLKRLGMKKAIAQLPKNRGFKRIKPVLNIVNISDLERCFKSGEEANVKTMLKVGIISDAQNAIKVLGKGTVSKKIIVRAHYFSKSAKEAILKAKGEVIETPKKVTKIKGVNKAKAKKKLKKK